MGADTASQMDDGKNVMKSILYITYDGLTDPLGQSQIIPYLQGLSNQGYRFTILSFEKNERFAKQKEKIIALLQPFSIQWVPLSFTRKPPVISKFYDAVRMKRTAFAICSKQQIDMIHCRSYIAADVGLALKRKKGIKFFFDMRGFWADEKKDAGSWNMRNPIFRQVYRYYKTREAQYIQHADHIISLTESGKKEMMRWPAYNRNVPLTVIPCCADMELFSLTNEQQKTNSRQLLQIENDRLVISYLGSIGAWYMLDEMLEMFRSIKSYYPSALFLFVTHSSMQTILDRLSRFFLSTQDVKIIEASRNEVPVFIKASDINISFIKPVYSKLSSSPTKLAEVLAMGLPVISNAGVGDVEAIVTSARAGIVIKDFTAKDYEQVVKAIPHLLKSDPATIRNNTYDLFSLAHGIDLYKQAYNQVFKTN